MQKIISQGLRNDLPEILLMEALEDRHIPARFVGLPDVPAELRPLWAKPLDYQPFFVLVPEERSSEAAEVWQYVIHRCKVCLECESYIKPGATVCPKCGTLAIRAIPMRSALLIA